MIRRLVTVFWSLQREISNTVTSPVIIVLGMLWSLMDRAVTGMFALAHHLPTVHQTSLQR